MMDSALSFLAARPLPPLPMEPAPTIRVAVLMERLHQPTRWETWRHALHDVLPALANELGVAKAPVHRGAATKMVRLFLQTPFAGGRHERRVKKIMALERS